MTGAGSRCTSSGWCGSFAAEFPGLQVFKLLEDVASAPQEVIQEYAGLIGGLPIKVCAADWGWVERRRLFWLQGPAGDITSVRKPFLPEGFELDKQRGQFTLRKTDCKVWPTLPRFEGGFAPAFLPEDVVGNRASPMPAFTREFVHPADRVEQVSAQARQRFEQDLRRFPPYA